jgi:hypothetical protein
MNLPVSDPGSKENSVSTSGASWPKQLEKMCGPACIVSPLYVLLNLESRRPLDAMKELWNAIGAVHGHNHIPSVRCPVMEGRVCANYDGLWKEGRVKGCTMDLQVCRITLIGLPVVWTRRGTRRAWGQQKENELRKIGELYRTSWWRYAAARAIRYWTTWVGRKLYVHLGKRTDALGGYSETHLHT